VYVYGWCGSGTGVEAGKGGGAGDVLKLLTNKPFLLAVLCGGCLQASHAMYYAFGTLSFAAQGYSGGVIGLLWSVGVCAEIVLFAATSALKKVRFGDGCNRVEISISMSCIPCPTSYGVQRSSNECVGVCIVSIRRASVLFIALHLASASDTPVRSGRSPSAGVAYLVPSSH